VSARLPQQSPTPRPGSASPSLTSKGFFSLSERPFQSSPSLDITSLGAMPGLSDTTFARVSCGEGEAAERRERGRRSRGKRG
jgi:hypothetical protein